MGGGGWRCLAREMARQPRGGSAPPHTPQPRSPNPTPLQDKLKTLYFDKIKPLEEQYNFGEFYSPSWKASDFDSKPLVLLLGQYSVGKTSFIRYIIGKDFPGARIGPEPTTDRFNAVMWGAEDRIVPGNALAVDPEMPFTSLTRFGTEFLNKFQASVCNSPVLEKVFFVDSPGVLSGEKQKLGRAYDFVKVCAGLGGGEEEGTRQRAARLRRRCCRHRRYYTSAPHTPA